MTAETTTPRATRLQGTDFVGYLIGLAHRSEAGDSTARARLARLRRTLTGRTLTYNGLSEVGDQLPESLHDDDLEAYLLVAALFALDPGTVSPRESLGATLRRLRAELSAGAESLDRRVTALLDADAGDLPYRLRQLVQQLASRGLTPDYLRLLNDLLAWNHPRRFVQRQWARDYWVG
ncbi:type I-E CRISPR-associated protein Cse2/CasB [Rhodocaloribacter litoris]|uniref:type I-E CRISPR-associated protein Cse2/CasB n=1 Tax=Rhodocaloribacter litoris TaxID=2558931 RepID=UPI0014224E4B|nr:type I-E CRISPR-associated protein Cse2/CasB [Rhodocaloribacter litoris]QXD16410.1 type I-E CRISPR-associated protein Cse2/CasB [Rhodocaloribacter litoris]